MSEENYLQFTRDEDYLGYHKYGTLTNGQTIYIGFRDSSYNNFIGYFVVAAIANKKKHIKSWLNEEMNPINLKCTGKCGLEGLLWTKNVIKEFEVFIKEMYPNEVVKIEIFWADQRRFRIYKRGLPDYQYSQSNTCLYKKLD